MKLPNANLAVIERKKIMDYLLNPAHPGNGGKAIFFLSLGFTHENWEVLADAFRESAETAEIIGVVESLHGRKYIQEGDMQSPDGKRHGICMVWIMETGKNAPRLVTAYPRE